MAEQCVKNRIVKKEQLKTVLAKSAMAVCVATSATNFVSQYPPQPTKPKAFSQSPDQKVSFMKKTLFAYNKPKPVSKSYLILGLKKEAVPVQKSPEGYPLDDFEFAVTAMDDLDKVSVFPSNEKRIYKVGHVNRVQGKILPPDTDDFIFDDIDLDTL